MRATQLISTLFFFVSMVITGTAISGEHAHWGYSGDTGPEQWGTMDEHFSVCDTGKNQSPINLTHMTRAKLPPLAVKYQAGGNEVVNNGHTIQVNYEPGNLLNIDGHIYELKQFHFHSPSENTINGHSFPMEAHFVHADKEGNLAVMSVMFIAGNFNPELEKAWAVMPEKAGDKQAIKQPVDARYLLPQRPDYYRFNGSLTTPPCSEGVTWVVLKDAQTASAEQIKHFQQVMQHPNNRPVQPVNARLIAR